MGRTIPKFPAHSSRGLCFSGAGWLAQRGLDNHLGQFVLRGLFGPVKAGPKSLPGSSVAEQVTVNHLVAGSIPARAAKRVIGLGVTASAVWCPTPSVPVALANSDNCRRMSVSDTTGLRAPEFCALCCATISPAVIQGSLAISSCNFPLRSYS